MATIRRKGSGWQAIIRRRGFPPLYETFPLKKQAEAWAAQRESEIVHGKLGILPQHTLAEALKEYREKKARNRWEVNRLKVLEQDKIAKVSIATLNSSHLADLKDRELARGVEGTTVRRQLSLLASVFKAAREWKWLAHNPFLDLERPAPKKGRARGLEGPRSTRPWRPWDGYGGARRTRPSRLPWLPARDRDGDARGRDPVAEWDQVHPKKVHLEKTKNGDEREVPLIAPRARAHRLHARHRRRECLHRGRGHARQALPGCAGARRLKGFTFHDSRSEASRGSPRSPAWTSSRSRASRATGI
jgi:hypothetical protein